VLHCNGRRLQTDGHEREQQSEPKRTSLRRRRRTHL
jgi:hypothetical protein